ncbi:MAG TPA: type II toxin-antitoxin system YhaV family toxin [Longimicrobium sp.]|nr:type II toxin-antitoxin system YhaV family toxin [Longimicrobium sp.]
MPISPEKEKPFVRHGWRLLAWSQITSQLEELRRDVRRIAETDPEGYRQHPRVKLFAAVRRLLLEIIPTDPNAPEFRLGNTLGAEHRHWRRAKFNGRFRLFFRFQSSTQTIIYVWMNDENTLRKSGGRTDPYSVFYQMLERGRPPSDWDGLLRESATLKDESPSSEAP